MNLFGFEIKFRRKQEKPRKRNYTGAQVNNLTWDWVTANLTSDEYLRWNLKRLRERSRDLERNDDYMRNFLRKLEINTVGAKGIILQSKVYFKTTNDLDIKSNSIIEDEWRRWARQYVSVCETLSLRDFLKIILRTIARDGEVLICKIRGYDNPYRYALQILEADFLDEDLNQDLPNGNRIIMGVEKNRYGKPVAYHLFEKHPGERSYAGNRHIRIPAEEILHLFIKERPTQSRGVPWVASAMIKLRMLGAYEEAEVVAARVAASKMGFFTEDIEGASYEGES